MAPFLPPGDGIGDRDGVLGMVDGHLDWTLRHRPYSQLLMRELMENRERLDRARNLSLRPVMARYIGYVRRGQAAGHLPDFDAEMFAFDFTGSIAHFVAAAPTIRRLIQAGPEPRLLARFRDWLRDSTLARLDVPVTDR